MKFRYVLMVVSGVLLAAKLSPGAKADLVLTLDQSQLSALPGATVDFTGNLFNTSTTDTVFLNGAGFSQLDAGLTGDETPFLLNTPLSLPPLGTLPASVTLFTVKLDNNLPPGMLSGVFDVYGGADSSAQNDLVQTSFHIIVQAVPEGRSGLGLLLLLGGGLAMRRGKKQAPVSGA